jgi:hypothetical protein
MPSLFNLSDPDAAASRIGVDAQHRRGSLRRNTSRLLRSLHPFQILTSKLVSGPITANCWVELGEIPVWLRNNHVSIYDAS